MLHTVPIARGGSGASDTAARGDDDATSRRRSRASDEPSSRLATESQSTTPAAHAPQLPCPHACCSPRHHSTPSISHPSSNPPLTPRSSDLRRRRAATCVPQTAELVVSGSFTSPKTHIPRFDSGPLLAFEHASERPSFHMVSFQASRNDVAHPDLQIRDLVSSPRTSHRNRRRSRATVRRRRVLRGPRRRKRRRRRRLPGLPGESWCESRKGVAPPSRRLESPSAATAAVAAARGSSRATPRAGSCSRTTTSSRTRGTSSQVGACVRAVFTLPVPVGGAVLTADSQR